MRVVTQCKIGLNRIKEQRCYLVYRFKYSWVQAIDKPNYELLFVAEMNVQ